MKKWNPNIADFTATYARCGGQITAVARHFEVSRKTVYAYIKVNRAKIKAQIPLVQKRVWGNAAHNLVRKHTEEK